MIAKIMIPEAPQFSYKVGENNVVSIDERFETIGSDGNGHTLNKLVYVVSIKDGFSIEISADVKGIVVYRIK